MVRRNAQANRDNRGRDREESRKRLIEAVGTLLAKKGFQAVGVNAVAREAGLDKVLIYRYFDGLPGLLSAFAAECDFWPSTTELAGGDVEAFRALPVVERIAVGVQNYMRALRRRPLTLEILAWMFLEPSEATRELDAFRERAGKGLLELADVAAMDASVDVAALMAVIGAAANHLCTRAGKIRRFAGMDLSSDEDWRRLETMMADIVKAVLAPAGGPAT